MKNLSEVRNTYPTLSLRRICDTLGLCYQYVLKASKQPIAGQPYSPDAFNDEAVAKIVARKGLDLDAYDWAAIAADVKVITPVNKPEEFAIGSLFTIRADEHTYTVVFTTDTHIVFLGNDETQPRVMNWDTFLHQSPRLVREDA